MKIISTTLLVFTLAISAFAQDGSGVAAACGAPDINFNVKLDKSQHRLTQPEPGKALIYFVQGMDEGTIKIGMDGVWVGANHKNSYFAVSVEPGEHHLCANPQEDSFFVQLSQLVTFAHFTAEAGKVYYFRPRLVFSHPQVLFDLCPVDSDEAKYLIASYPLSVQHPKANKKP